MLTRLLLTIFFLVPLVTQAQEEVTAYSVLKKQNESRKGYVDLTSTGQMLLQDPNGRVQTQREFEFLQIEQGNAENILIRIIKPADLSGTALLTLDAGGQKEEQWLYLPSTKKSRRIAGKGRGGRFLGSEFSYEDLIPARFDSYSHALKGKMPCGEFSCYIIEQKSREETSAYSKRVLQIRSDTYQTIQVDLYDRKDTLIKQATFENYELHGTHWQPRRIVMKDKQSGRQTVLNITQLTLAGGIPASRFSPNNLERP